MAARLASARVLLVHCAPEDIDLAQHHLDDRARLYSEVADVEARLVGHGDPAEVILATAASEPDAILCMATHGRSGIGAAVLGSVANEVVRHAPCPVLITRPTDDRSCTDR